MLAHTRRQQLMAAHREDRAVPDGIPDGLRNMWSDTAALDNFLSPTPPGLGAAPLADVPPPPPDVPPPVVEAPARPVVDLMSFEPPAAQPPADAQPKPEAPAPHVPDLLNLFQPEPADAPKRVSFADDVEPLQPEPAAPADVQPEPYDLGSEFWRGWHAAAAADGPLAPAPRDDAIALPAADAARPAADAARPAEVTLDELEALRARCAELEARIPEQEALKRRCEDLEARVEALESDDPWQYLEHDFAERLQDIAERLRALERPWEQWR